MTRAPIRARSTTAISLCSLIASLSCIGPGDAGSATSKGISVRDSAGIQIVEHTAEYMAALPTWTIDSVPIAQVVGDAPGSELSMVRDAVRRRDGTFLVADQRQRDIRLFNAAGTESRVIARAGRGPGEVGYVRRMQLLANDTLLYDDSNNRRLNVFALDGRFVRQHAYPQFANGAQFGFIAYRSDGRAFGTLRPAFMPPATPSDVVRRDPLVIATFGPTADSPGATHVDTIAVVPDLEVYDQSTTENGETRPDLYPLRFGKSTVIGTDGVRLFVSTNERNEIVEYGNAGVVRRIRSGIPAAPFTDEDRERFTRDLTTQVERSGRPPSAVADFKHMLETWRYAKSFAYYDRLFVGADGTVWAEVPWVVESDARRYVVYGGDGHALAQVEFSPRVVPLRMSRTEILGTFTDDADVPHVMVWRVRERMP